jgi:hypothetical protein
MKFVLVFLLSLSAMAGASSSSSQAVSAVHQVSFEITKKLKIPPPQMALIASVANTTAYSLVNSQLAYTAAFIEIYALAYPSERVWVDQILKDFTSAQDLRTIQNAKKNANTQWNQVLPLLQKAGAALSTPWPPEGYAEGHWRPTPPAFAQPLYPNWHQLFTYSDINVKAELDLILPRLFNVADYQKEMFEVHQLGSINSQSRNPAQTQMAVFWAAGGGTITPPGMWMESALQLLKNEQVGFKNSARTMMLLTQALSDAGVAAWAAKYKHATCRPVTAIADFMAQPDWKPLLATPPFPAWVSGHSTFSAAAAMVLDSLRLIKASGIAFQSEAVPNVTKSFPTAYQAALEAGMSRIYGGIHFQDDNTDGLQLGQKVGCAVMIKNGLQCKAENFSHRFPFR